MCYGTYNSDSLLLEGKQIGLMESDRGTLSLRRSSAMSLSKLVSVNLLAMARSTKRVSGLVVELQRLCSPNVTFTMNHIKLKIEVLLVTKMSTITYLLWCYIFKLGRYLSNHWRPWTTVIIIQQMSLLCRGDKTKSMRIILPNFKRFRIKHVETYRHDHCSDKLGV